MPLLVLWCFISNLTYAASIEVLRLELGEEYTIPIQKTSSELKVWIEKRDILQAEARPSAVLLKTRLNGSSFVRIGTELKKVLVYKPGTRAATDLWRQKRGSYSHLELRYCDFLLCLTGQISSVEQFEQMRQLVTAFNVPVQIKVAVASQLLPVLLQKMSLFLRQHGFTPQKIVLDGLWRMYLERGKPDPELLRVASQIGLHIQMQDKINSVTDNVSVSVKIVEINKSLVRKFGVTWPDQYNANVLQFQNLRPAESFEIFLTAAEASGEARVLASPRLMARSGQQADFFAGGEFPIKVQGLRSNHVAWRKYGVSLNLKPVTDPFGQLSLSIETEISTVDNSMKVEDLPAVQINRVSSQFDMINQKTIALSGLIRHETGKNQSGLPYLQHIPVLGSLFSSRQFTENKSELVVFVTPKLMTEEEFTP